MHIRQFLWAREVHKKAKDERKAGTVPSGGVVPSRGVVPSGGVVPNLLETEGKATVVDLGGSAGHDAVVLARNFPDLNIIVQDLPKVKPVFEAELPSDVKTRVSFIAHNFFQPQPVEADIYIIKLILHDWPDLEAAKILRALVPALKPGARVILVEYIGKHDSTEGSSLPRSVQQMGTATDLRIMALFNAKERVVDDWKNIFHNADERFDVTSVKANPETFFAVVEAVWRG
ncbi:hypothetical protein ACJ72_06036 [Emergomyces africanus]|uniref:O-methyltransferase C-terminal domain-containing protein n=1 Tax=Emergomyces africanus TaxID=1955775 RepID=A0A1B7NSA5_9EURO|nr:hypothetical protein ACJ72_06036 [Emergomyces africanus]